MSTPSYTAALSLVIGLLFSACSSNQEPAPSADVATTPTELEADAPAPIATDVVEVAAGSPAEVRLNPPHGEPGHRCEIPVGAPLDGSSDQSSIQPAANVQNPIVPIGPAAPANGSARLNPPHGEPGHDCAVPVGSPLPG